MQILDGKALAARMVATVKNDVASLPRRPGLAVVLVGENPASDAYVRQKRRAAEECGYLFEEISFPETVTTDELLLEIARLNTNDNIDGLIVQLPLPSHIDKAQIIPAIDPAKDVDGFHPMNHGRTLTYIPDAIQPATPAGVMRLLDEYQIDVTGKECVVVGHSNIVGKPMAILLINRDATVTVCHHMTRDLAAHTRNADIIISATGVADIITPDMVKDDVVIVDVGIIRVGGKLRGDVDYDGLKEKASYITPVPGGVGPMTVAMLIENVFMCAKRNMQ